MEKAKRYMGFISGYKARNIASMEDTIFTQIETLSDLFTSMKSSQNDPVFLNDLDRIIGVLKDIDSQNLFDRIYLIGEIFKSDITFFRADSIFKKSKKVILILGQLAEVLEDKKLRSQVIDIGNIFISPL